MRLATSSKALAITLAIAAVSAPGAHAGGLLSGPAPDPRAPPTRRRRASCGSTATSHPRHPSRRRALRPTAPRTGPTGLRGAVPGGAQSTSVASTRPGSELVPRARSEAVAPILRPARASELAAINRAESQEADAFSYSLPRTARYSNADLNAYADAVHPVAVTTPAVGASSNGFDYGDAAIGAGSTAAILVLITAAGLVLCRRRQPRRP
jgi:hypothetical protein